jgi:hypothetical protein
VLAIILRKLKHQTTSGDYEARRTYRKLKLLARSTVHPVTRPEWHHAMTQLRLDHHGAPFLDKLFDMIDQNGEGEWALHNSKQRALSVVVVVLLYVFFLSSLCPIISFDRMTEFSANLMLL